MMKKVILVGVIFPFLLCSSLFLTSCNEDEVTEVNQMPGEMEFSRSDMLASLADTLIIPNFETLQGSLSELSSSTDDFVQNTTADHLTALRAAWVKAVTDHQHCSAFGFGPASLSLGAYGDVLGIFPVDEAEVEESIVKEDFNLASSFSRDIRGFFAIEYLIYGKDQADTEIIESFDQDRKDYLVLIVAELKTTIDEVVSEWNTDYRDEFVNNDGTAAGSSVSLLYNEFVRDFEGLKNFKVELPAGLTAGQSSSEPSLVEAYYSGISKELLIVHFESIKNIWKGQARGGDDILGFEEYLESLEEGPALIATTEAAITAIDNALAALPEGKLAEIIESPEVETLRDQLQANTPNFKSTMSSLLGISITFSSGDGD